MSRHGGQRRRLELRLIPLVALLATAFTLAVTAMLRAQTAPAPRVNNSAAGVPAPQVGQDNVVEVRIEGATNVSTLPKMSTRAGTSFDPKAIEDDVRSLDRTRRFIDIKPRYQFLNNGLVVIFQVVERPVVRFVKFIGMEKVKESTLKKEAELKVGDSLDPHKIEEARRKLETYYHEHGYPNALVYTVEGNKTGDRGAVFVINEGTKQAVWWTDFVGNTIADDSRLRTQIQSKPGILWLGGSVDRNKIDDDVKKLTEYYRSLGFFQARVGREFQLDEKGWMSLTFVIHEGPRYKVRNFSVIGNQKFTPTELLKNMVQKSGDDFDQAKLNQDLNTLRDLYGGQGHIFCDIQADTRFLEEPGMLDIVYNVQEGAVYRVGEIQIEILGQSGEPSHSRQRTVLNRISLRPGDIIDTRLLRADEVRLKRSGLFLNDPTKGAPPQIVVTPPPGADDETKALADKGGKRPNVRYQSPDGARVVNLTIRATFAGEQPVPKSVQPPLPTTPPAPIRWEARYHPEADAAWQPIVAPGMFVAPQAAPTREPNADPTLAPVRIRRQSPDPRYYAAPAAQPLNFAPPPAATAASPLDARYVAQTAPAYQQTNPPAYSPAPPTLLPASGIAPDSYRQAGPDGQHAYFAQEQNAGGYAVRPAQYSPPDGTGQSLVGGAATPYFSAPNNSLPLAGGIAPNAPLTGFAPPAGQPGVFQPGAAQPGAGGILPQPGPVGEGVPPGDIGYQVMPEDGYADINPRVTETQTGRIMFGVGVNSNAGVIGNIVLDEQNFDIWRPARSWEDFISGRAWRGAGQRFRMEAAPGSQVSRYTISFQEPYLWDTPVGLSLSGFYFQRSYRDWFEERTGGRFGLGYQLPYRPDLSVSAKTRIENINISNPRDPNLPELAEIVGHNDLYGFSLGLAHDTRDSPFLPTQGWFAQYEAEYVTGSFDYPRGTVEMRRYYTLTQRADGSGRHVLSLGGDLGITGPDTPIYDNFFAGGYSTLRGFRFRGASPRAGNDVIVGGELMLLGSVEYMLPITADDALRAVAFCDFGTVEETTDFNADAFRLAIGVGMRISVPALGPAPIALDFAVPLMQADFDQEQIFTFFVGLGR